MSYLNTLRFHFAGKFQADVSTVNNDAGHYDNATFDRSVDWVLNGGGSWNPEGSHRFAFESVKVASAFLEDGSAAAAGDAILGLMVSSTGRIPAKLVDLDPDHQLTSTIFGLKLALAGADGRTLFNGSFEPAAFFDIWRRGATGGGDEAACAAYQSVIRVDSWGDLSASPFLQQLRAHAPEDLLSIKFQVDGYSMTSGTPGYTKGRIVGTIGPAASSEPRHWVKGRHIGAEIFAIGKANPGFQTRTKVNYHVAAVEQNRGKVLLDLGNALMVAPAGGPLQKVGPLALGCFLSDGRIANLGQIPYDAAGWYEQAAGIAEIPVDRSLSAVELEAVENGRLCLLSLAPGQPVKILSQEPDSHVKADQLIARLNPGDSFSATLHASGFGKALSGARIHFFLAPLFGGRLPASFPRHGLQFPEVVTCDAGGNATVVFTGADPGNPRYFYDAPGIPRQHVDGQIYKVGFSVEIEGRIIPTANPSDFFSILVWNAFQPDEPPTWHGSMGSIFAQYGNLYPFMTRSPRVDLDLADYTRFAEPEVRESIIRVLSVDEGDPSHMPVSRDLSKARREAMLRWLRNPGPDGKPLPGTQPVAAAAAAPGPVQAIRARSAPGLHVVVDLQEQAPRHQSTISESE